MSVSPDPIDVAQASASPAIAAARRLWAWLCTALIVVGLVMLALSLPEWLEPKGLAVYIGCFLALYGGMVVLQRLPAGWLGRTLRQRLRAAVVSSGVGFYGVMTLARFLQLEVHDLLGLAVEFELSRSLVSHLIRDWLIGFSMQSLMNSIDAMMWPVMLMREYGMPVAAAVVLSTWSLYALGARTFPEVHAELEADEDELDDEQQGDEDRLDQAAVPPSAERPSRDRGRPAPSGFD